MSDAPGWQRVDVAHAVATFSAGRVDVWRLTAARGAPAVRALIARYAGRAPDALQLVAGPHGKPALAASPLRFNLSHSGGTTLLAFALAVEVGVDVEHARVVRRRDALLARCFTVAEQQRLRDAVDADTALLAAWTAKEAVLKAVGRGLAYGMRQVELDLDEPLSPRLLSLAGPAGPAPRWQLRLLPSLAGASAALAHRAATAQLRCFAM